jgi:hypothetical protein
LGIVAGWVREGTVIDNRQVNIFDKLTDAQLRALQGDLTDRAEALVPSLPSSPPNATI